MDAAAKATAEPFYGFAWQDWLPAMMREWAWQYSRINNAGYMARDAKGVECWHFDGWPIASVLGKIKTDAEGAGQGARKQHFAEVYVGNGLVIRRAMEGLPYQWRAILHAIYLAKMPWREQAKHLEMSRTAYWEQRNYAHVHVAGRVPLIKP